MSADLPKVNIPVTDRILLHLAEHKNQNDRFMVSSDLTRPGIAEACALHAPNVSRAMRDLLKKGAVSEHSRSIIGDERRQKTWQLTESGIENANKSKKKHEKTDVLIRDQEGTLLEIEASKVSERLEADLTLLQILLHAQHEGVLTYGDIRFGPIRKGEEESLPIPGKLTLLAGAHATYHFHPPKTRLVHGRDGELEEMNEWFDSRRPCMVIDGIAGIGKSTLVANWLEGRIEEEPNLSVCWYPCQIWDRELGLATSLLHRFGIDEKHDPYQLMETLPLSPGAIFNVDSWRRRLLAYLTDATAIRERFKDEAGGPPPYWLIVLDDIHHVSAHSKELLGALLQMSTKAPLRLVMISRTSLDIYDRRDVHTRNIVRELSLKGLSIDEVGEWLESFEGDDVPSAGMIHNATGGHPLAMELLELYGTPEHEDWLRFLDEEIIIHMPKEERNLLATLAQSAEPIAWEKLAKACQWNGEPPKRLISHGLLMELEGGMWLHEALRERLLREVGQVAEKRRKKLN